jgi:transposase
MDFSNSIDRFDVSLGMVKKLLSQRRRIGDIASQRHRCGRKPLIDEDCRNKLRELVESRPDATLQEMRSALGLDCTLVAIHYALIRMGLAYKKRRSTPASKTAPMSPKRGASGNASTQSEALASGLPRGICGQNKHDPPSQTHRSGSDKTLAPALSFLGASGSWYQM